MQFRHGYAVICLLLLDGCVSMGWSTHPTASIEDRDMMRETILEHIPPGTTLEEAKEFMENEGFKCRLVEGEATERTSLGSQEPSEPTDANHILWCDRHDTVRWPVSRHWQVSIELEDDRVTGISPYYSYLGP